MITLSDSRRKLLEKFANCEDERVSAYAAGLADALQLAQGETPLVTATLRKLAWQHHLDRTVAGQLLDLLLDLLSESDMRAVCGISGERRGPGHELSQWETEQ